MVLIHKVMVKRATLIAAVMTLSLIAEVFCSELSLHDLTGISEEMLKAP